MATNLRVANVTCSTSLHARLHFHCGVIGGVFDAAANEVGFQAVTALEANAIATRRRRRECRA